MFYAIKIQVSAEASLKQKLEMQRTGLHLLSEGWVHTISYYLHYAAI